MRRQFSVIGAALLGAGVIVGAAMGDGNVPTARLNLSSAAFENGAPIPARYTCDGKNVSPPLRWTGVPEGTRAFALACEDPDAPGGLWVHWVLYGLGSRVRSLPEAVPAVGSMPSGVKQGRNSFRRIGYGGPCPPAGERHRYVFRLFALDSSVAPHGDATETDLLKAIRGHVLAEGKLVGTFHR